MESLYGSPLSEACCYSKMHNVCAFLKYSKMCFIKTVQTNHQKEGVKMIMTKSKRVISLILVFVMIFSIIPVFPAFAEEITGYEDD